MKKSLASASWCGPCMVVKNRIKQLGLEDKVEIKDFDTKEDEAFFKQHNIRSIPRLVVEKDDGTVEIIQGSDEIIAAIQADA